MNKVTLIASAISLALGVSACSGDKSPEESIISAEQAIAQKNYSTAVIELKNAIQISPKDPKIRLLLGKTYLQQGLYLNAEKELERAQSLGVDYSQLSSSLALLYSRLNKAVESFALIDQSSSLSDEQYLTTLLYAAITSLNNNEHERAIDLLQQAMSFDEEYKQVKLANAYYQYAIGDYDAGVRALESINTGDLLFTEALLIKGHLLFAKKDFLQAADSFKNFQQSVPLDNQVFMFVINSLFLAQEYEKAENQANKYLARNPDSPLALFFKGKIEYQKKNYQQAQEFAERAFQLNSNMISAKNIAGLSAFHLEKYEQSFAYISAVLKQYPQNKSLRAIMSYLKVKLDYEEGDGLSEEEVQKVIESSHELIMSGHLLEAKKVLSNSKFSMNSPSSQLSQAGLLKVSLKDENGFELLKKAVEDDPSSLEARIALATAYYKTSQFQEALAFIAQWQKDQPQSVEAYNFAAKIYIREKQFEKAELELNKSLEVAPKNIYALLYYIDKDIKGDSLDSAEAKLKDALKDNPEHISLLGLLYQLSLKKGDTTNAVELIRKSFQRNSSNHLKKLFFASILFIDKNYEEVVEILNGWHPEKVRPIRYYELLVTSLTQQRQFDEALVAVDSWIQQSPKEKKAWFTRISILEKVNNTSELVKAIEEMGAVFPSSNNIRGLIPYYQILNRDFKAAEASIEKLNVSHYSPAYIDGLTGQILFGKGEYENALPKLISFYNETSSSRNAGFVYTSLIKLKKRDGALEFIEAHLSKFPNDKVTKVFYAQYLLKHDVDKARSIYQELLGSSPKNAVFLNNLAWIEYSSGNLTKAQNYAERADVILPDNAIILDTLSLIYFKQGKQKSAVEVSTRAKELAPNDKEIIEHYGLITGKS